MKLKKAAMFGLDARIALAIFGALSVISGAALYSAIQQAKTEQFRQYFEEIIKATEQYYLDNGKVLPEYTSNDYVYIGDLASNRESLSTWAGPYLAVSSVDSSHSHFMDSMTAQVHSTSETYMLMRKSSTWTEMNDLNADGICASNDPDCADWITLSAVDASATLTLLSIFNNLDESVDGGDGMLAGKVRYNTAANDHIMYRGIPRKNN
tara:strand:- start:1262 stop:1888 length:627 start_codon:yes stop_codon:yes gene_type:complete